jgi:hypothetical protein
VARSAATAASKRFDQMQCALRTPLSSDHALSVGDLGLNELLQEDERFRVTSAPAAFDDHALRSTRAKGLIECTLDRVARLNLAELAGDCSQAAEKVVFRCAQA